MNDVDPEKSATDSSELSRLLALVDEKFDELIRADSENTHGKSVLRMGIEAYKKDLGRQNKKIKELRLRLGLCSRRKELSTFFSGLEKEVTRWGLECERVCSHPDEDIKEMVDHLQKAVEQHQKELEEMRMKVSLLRRESKELKTLWELLNAERRQEKINKKEGKKKDRTESVTPADSTTKCGKINGLPGDAVYIEVCAKLSDLSGDIKLLVEKMYHVLILTDECDKLIARLMAGIEVHEKKISNEKCEDHKDLDPALASSFEDLESKVYDFIGKKEESAVELKDSPAQIEESKKKQVESDQILEALKAKSDRVAKMKTELSSYLDITRAEREEAVLTFGWLMTATEEWLHKKGTKKASTIQETTEEKESEAKNKSPISDSSEIRSAADSSSKTEILRKEILRLVQEYDRIESRSRASRIEMVLSSTAERSIEKNERELVVIGWKADQLEKELEKLKKGIRKIKKKTDVSTANPSDAEKADEKKNKRTLEDFLTSP